MTKNPSPSTTLISAFFSAVSISVAPPLAGTKVGVRVAFNVVELDTEGVFEAELDVGDAVAETDVVTAVVELRTFWDETDEDPGADDASEEDVDAGAGVEEEDVTAGRVDEAGGVVAWLELGMELELEPATGTGTTTPPCTVLNNCDEEVPAALVL